MTHPSVFEYSDYRDFLKDRLTHVSPGVRPVPLSKWADKFGFKSRSLLTMILQRKRRLPAHAIPRIAQTLKLKNSEFKYLENLISLTHAKQESERLYYAERARHLNPAKEFKEISIETFRLAKDPLHIFILEMTNLSGFKDDPEWIRAHLRFPQTLAQVKEAYQRLFELGLLKRIDGKVLCQSPLFTTTQDVPNQALREFHRASMDLASKSMEEIAPEEREISGITFTMKSESLAKVKEAIKEFRRQLMKTYEIKGGDQTIQVNLQMFPVSNRIQKKEKTHDKK